MHGGPPQTSILGPASGTLLLVHQPCQHIKGKSALSEIVSRSGKLPRQLGRGACWLELFAALAVRDGLTSASASLPMTRDFFEHPKCQSSAINAVLGSPKSIKKKLQGSRRKLSCHAFHGRLGILLRERTQIMSTSAATLVSAYEMQPVTKLNATYSVT